MASLPEAVLETMASRNASLQARYFILATRAFGLDYGLMSGFNQAKIDETFYEMFFSGTSWKSNFPMKLCYNIRDNLKPRLGFGDACRIE